MSISYHSELVNTSEDDNLLETLVNNHTSNAGFGHTEPRTVQNGLAEREPLE